MSGSYSLHCGTSDYVWVLIVYARCSTDNKDSPRNAMRLHELGVPTE